jgi:hypothetical protein
MIPKIYDTQRVARIIGVDGETNMVKIDPTQPMPMRELRDPNNPDIVIDKIYNPGVGKYDVCVTTGPSYMTKRQEALDAMTHLLQGNPQLWAVAGDLFIKNMDWPGAEEMAQRFAKTIDPKLLADEDKSPQLQAAEQQMQAMQAEMDKMHAMLQSVHKSVEVQDLERKEFEAAIKAYDAETKRMQALQASMSPEQIQDIVLGTVHGMISSGDLLADMPNQQLMGEEQPAAPGAPGAPPIAPEIGAPSVLVPGWSPYQANPEAPIRR